LCGDAIIAWLTRGATSSAMSSISCRGIEKLYLLRGHGQVPSAHVGSWPPGRFIGLHRACLQGQTVFDAAGEGSVQWGFLRAVLRAEPGGVRKWVLPVILYSLKRLMGGEKGGPDVHGMCMANFMGFF
jgi:hypothetical protein